MLQTVVTTAAISLAVYVLIAVGLILWPAPRRSAACGPAAQEFAGFLATGGFAPPAPPERFRARDGAERLFRRYGQGRDTLVFLHGSGSDSAYLAGFASDLAERSDLTVLTLDMRGHGASPVRRGDVDDVAQQERDIADLLAAVRPAGAGGRVLIGGHSIGGGLAIRYAAGSEHPRPDAVLLVCPFVHRKSPAARRGSGGWASPRITRFAGIEMLHRLGVRAFDRLPVIDFAVGTATADATPTYSWRLFASVTPRSDWQADIARIPCPAFVLGAQNDTIFNAAGYAECFAGNPNATVEIVPGMGHFALSLSSEAPRRCAAWLDTLAPRRAEAGGES